ncbi:hypothetical protein A3715_35330 [Oleiphilus sp. HI0009]|nr:hypothetical protein A3715_14075 [Oleiphilus sp. HI0009]KZX81467.1 hypothetical protein A3715_35330 [Oleiphilus sp. HI0009]
MNKQKQLGLAIEIAVKAHADQVDKGGNPYILHPLHIMNELMFDTELATIGVLHDVIEDSDVSIEDLVGIGFSKRVTEALDLLTHKDNQTYQEYIDGISNNYDAIRVKRKDLEHNSDITRLKGIRDKDLKRIEKYHKAFLQLGEAKKHFQ